MSARRPKDSTPPHGDPLGVAADAAPTGSGDPEASRHGRRPDADAGEGAPGPGAPTGGDEAGRSEQAAAPGGDEAGRSEQAAAPGGDEEGAAADPDPLAAARAEAADFRDRYLRAEAELQNVRKRAARDVAAAQDRGMARLAKELLTAFDHFELALQAAEEHDAGEWVKGIRLVQDELTGALARVGIEAFAPQGEPFDPNQHEAMAQQPSEEAEPGTVLQVYQQGYRLNGQVLRPARVVVASGAS